MLKPSLRFVVGVFCYIFAPQTIRNVCFGSGPQSINKNIISMSNIIKYEEVRMVESSEIDRVVEKIYQLPFTYQQQGVYEDIKEPYENCTVPSGNNFHEGMPLEEWAILEKPISTLDRLFFIVNSYPNFQQVLNELHRRGLMPEGKYIISV